MSYDVSIGRHASFNYTYNCGPMFHRAIPGGINALDGLTGRQALDVLAEGIAIMKTHPESFKLQNPPNGWGNYEGAIRFLEEIWGACNVSRRSKIRVS